MPALEHRRLPATPAPVVSKRADGTPSGLAGYAAVFYSAADPGTEYRLWDDIVERVRPGAFDRALKDGDDCRCLFNHDPNQMLGRTQSKTCRLSVDGTGLKYECDAADTAVARDVLAHLQRGDVTGSSFSFVPTRTTWEEVRDADGKGSTTYVRWIEEVRLYDVGPVTFPAYEAATSGTRAQARDQVAAGARAERDAWKTGPAAAADADRVRVAALAMQFSEQEDAA